MIHTFKKNSLTLQRLLPSPVPLSDVQIAHLNTQEFFTGGPFIDTSGVADSKLHILLSTLKRTIKKGLQILLQLPLDAKGCDICNVDVATCVTALRNNYPHLHAQIDLKVSNHTLSCLLLHI